MKKIMKRNVLYRILVSLAIVLNVVLISCDDDDIPGASYQPGVWFYASGDRVTSEGKLDMEKFNSKFSGFYSFYFHQELDVDTFSLAEIRLMGFPEDRDREVKLVAGEGTTAVEGVHFKIVNNVLPANATSFVPKILLIKKDLGEEEKVVKFELKPSEEFPAQVFGDTLSDDNTFVVSLHYELKFSNVVSEPPYWNQTRRFGEWSRVKYEFMVEKLGRYWGAEPISPSDMTDLYNDVLRMRYELAQWEKAHNGEKMKDENGGNISF